MEVAPGLHLIDGMKSGMVNAYVWERPDGNLTLIDAGMPNDADSILRFLQSWNLDRLDRVIITHGDIDHVGGLARIKAATGARVICHAVEKPLVEQKQMRRPKQSLAGWLVLLPYVLVMKTILRYSAVEVDELVLDRELLPEGFQVVHAPGHTAGQIALFEPDRGILIAADAMANRDDKLARPVGLFTPQMDVAEDSIRRLAGLRDVKVVCFGHGQPIAEMASERLQQFASSL